jgi:hypothetical protein
MSALLVIHGVCGRSVAVGIAVAALPVLLLFLGYGDDNRCGCIRNTNIWIHTVEQAMAHYQTDHANPCPPSLQTLVDERYLSRLPRDEWGQPLRMTCPGSRNGAEVDVVSAGKDGRFGTADDVKSWDL